MAAGAFGARVVTFVVTGSGVSWENNGWAGRDFHYGLRARCCSWPPLRLARLCCEHVSVVVVRPPVSHTSMKGEGNAFDRS